MDTKSFTHKLLANARRGLWFRLAAPLLIALGLVGAPAAMSIDTAEAQSNFFDDGFEDASTDINSGLWSGMNWVLVGLVITGLIALANGKIWGLILIGLAAGVVGIGIGTLDKQLENNSGNTYLKPNAAIIVTIN